jgi:hypothetical protein
MIFRLTTFVVLLLALAAGACSNNTPECRVGADCASGICRSDGTCEPVGEDGGTDGEDGTVTDGADGDEVTDGGDRNGEADGSADGGETEEDGDGGGFCQPNHNRVIERDEVSLRVGLHATFRVAQDATVDTAGQSQPDGSRVWDLSGALPGDHSVIAELQSPIGTWYAPEFPEATYVSKLRDGENLLGVFQVTDQALLLLGVVSPDDGITKTELHYDPPVTVLSFPFQEGNSWSTDSTVSGLALGVYTIYSEDYDNQVDAYGRLETPYGSFEVLRVRVVLTRTVGIAVTRIRTFSFAAECFGTVANIHSNENESEEEFTEAAEVWRLTQ